MTFLKVCICICVLNLFTETLRKHSHSFLSSWFVVRLTLAFLSHSACLVALSMSPPAASQARFASPLDSCTPLLDSSWEPPLLDPESSDCRDRASDVDVGGGKAEEARAQISSNSLGSSAFNQLLGVTLVWPATRTLAYTSSGLTPFRSPSCGGKRKQPEEREVGKRGN